MKDRTRAARRGAVIGKTAAPKKRVNANQWYRIENLVDRPSTAAIYIYDVIGCTCWWDDDCRCMTAKNLIDELQGLRVDELHIHINSPGGEVDDGIAIYNTLRNHSARKTTFIDSLAASAASFIALAADEVVIALTGQVMIHDASTIAIGDANELRETADLLDRYSNNIAGIYSRKSGRSVEDFRELMRAETWFTGAEAVEAGLADRTDEDDTEDGDDDMQQRMTARHNLSLFAFRYAGRELAPAPALTNQVAEPEPQAPAEPEPQGEPEPERSAVAAEPEAEAPEPAEDPTPADDAVVVPDASGSDEIETGQQADDEAAEPGTEPEETPADTASSDEAPAEPVAETPDDEPEPVPAETAPVPEPVKAATDTDSWAQLWSPLISATPASPTWDDAFASLTKP
ncbi:head maturation protease, ClpP-related [Lentzea sp. NPDC092896]|uniref:head maturation protease, ClpP-related n=1 Tax=Lentzea sp. NPDC092896 TaxID=3364127 RepID=UPI00381B51C3